MARLRRRSHAIAAALLGLVVFPPALAEDQGSKNNDLYERPTLLVDPGMHTAKINGQAVDAAGRFAITGGDDRTVRVWSLADGKLLKTIWIPVGPQNVGAIYAVAISPDGATIAAGGMTERRGGPCPIYIFDRESGNLIRRIGDDLPNFTGSLTFSPDDHFLAATLGGRNGLRVFERDKDWREAFRDDRYGDSSYGAAFTRDGRLATTALDGLIRLYRYDPNSDIPSFRRVGEPVEAPSGKEPYRVAFSADDKRLAVGYDSVAAVDVLDGVTLERLGVRAPGDVTVYEPGLSNVSWSRNGQTLFATGGVQDRQGRLLLFAWDQGGLGGEQRMTYCAPNAAIGVNALPGGRIFVASMEPCVGLMDAGGKQIWSVASPVLDLRNQLDVFGVSRDGQIVDFHHGGAAGPLLRFNVRTLSLSSPSQSDAGTSAPNREGLKVDGWRNGTHPTLDGRELPVHEHDLVRSLAIGPDAKRFFLGSAFALTAFDDAGTQKWRWQSRSDVWAVNTSQDGRVVITADSDGAIRWHRADDGRELLALQVLPNKEGDPAKWDWVLWTPEGFYEATQGAENVLKWVVNHGPDKAASTKPVSAIAKLHRPDALRLVLDQLETERAVGIAEVAAARLDVQTATGSAKPPGGVLRVLAVGVDKFGDNAGGLHLDYAAEDAHDVADALFESQKIAPGKASLYADVKITYLPNDKASKTAIEDALDAMAESMAKSGADQDTAVILVSSHGEMIGGQFYFIPYGFVANGTPNAATDSAIPASVFGKKVSALAAHGKVLVLLDACHSGAVGAGGWATDPNAKALQDAMDFENVTVLTSSKRSELSEELPEWKHGALAQAFLDALAGAADSQGIVTRSALTDAMEKEVQSLTKGKQHLGMHVNFSGDLFMASHY
jgi:WD40 repeat protein